MAEVGTQPQGSQGPRSQQSNRELRHSIRNLAATVQREGDDLADVNNLPRIGGVLDELNKYHALVEKPREQVEDSTCLMLISNKAADMAKKVARNGGKQQGPRDFAQVLKHLFSGDQTDEPDPDRFRWSDLSDIVGKYFKPASGVSCMLGPMEAEAKVRKAPQRRQPKQPLGDVRRAEEVPEQAGDKQDTDRHMELIFNALVKQKSAGLLELVINHKSFSQTVENLFALSFLVRDVRAKLTESDRGLVVHLNEHRKASKDENGEERNKMQFIIGFTVADWEEWRNYVRPEDCLLEHRDDVVYTRGAIPSHAGRNQKRAPPAREADDQESEQEEDESSDEAPARPTKKGRGSSTGKAKR